MKKMIAELISFVFHPVIFLILAPFLLIYKQTSNEVYAFKWLIFSSIFVVLGVLLFFIGRIRGTFSDFDLSKKDERRLFYIYSWFLAVIYLMAAVVIKGIFFPLSLAALGIVLGLIIFELVNYTIKASIHIGALAAWVTAVGLLYGEQAFFVFFLILPIVTWSRLVLKRHTFKEIIVGGFLGSTITLLTFLIGKQLL